MTDTTGCPQRGGNRSWKGVYYETVKSFSVVNDLPGLYTKDEVKADLEKKAAAGEIGEDEVAEYLSAFNTVVEFCESHKVKIWMPLPPGVTTEQIEEAVKAGQIEDCDGERFCAQTKPWKSIGGKYYYDTGEQREIFGEAKSP